MTEEVKTEEQVEEKPEQQTEPSGIELKALEMGWRPRTEFQGTDDEFIDAKEFVRRKPLFDEIEIQGRQIKTVTKALEQLKEHYTKVSESAYNKAIQDLKAQRKEALSNGDGETFEKLDDKIKDAEAEKAQLEQLQIEVPKVEEAHPEFVSWKSRNRWYDTVGYMKEFADTEGRKLHARGLEPHQVLKEVEKLVRAEFPHKFKNPNKDSAPALESSGGTTKRGNDSFDMTDLERKIMNDLVRQKVMTKEQYIADLKKVKGIA